jgi:transposase InsO family protein
MVDTFAPFLPDPTSADKKPHFLDQIQIEGDEELQAAIRALCLEFEHIFSDTLGDMPADIPPFKIEVKLSEWETHKNSRPVRPQTAKKEAEIAKHIQTMLRSGVIEPSSAHYWNHPVIVTKPDGTFRFCIDFRILNACSQQGTFPLLIIAAILLRIGEHKPDTFGVMDLTSGYHQAPLHPESRSLTAFICFAGVFQFTRVPFGPTRAPSYFQEMMTAVVLCGLVYLICEMYLDDCIVFGRGNFEFISRLRLVFQRFDERKIFLKAKKCKFGLKKIGYVGKEISKEGINMSEDKIQHVLDFPKPMTNTQLRSFLGLANYFREFVPNHSTIVHPLQGMIDFAATKRTAIKWTPDGETAFVAVKGLIARCPLLHFVDDSSPITLMTDASDYGIGGYLFQRVDGIDQPIAFVSKSLTENQLRWSTIQKEAYAIFYCCTKLNALLQDRKFTILTDHANLQFLKNDSNQMVVRWWLAIQELDYILRFVPGVENVIADTLSRLCPNLLRLQPGDIPDAATELLAAISVKEVLPDAHTELIVTCHNSTVGHNGVERTIARLLNAGHKWPCMRQNVKDFIKECACCQKTSAIKTFIQTQPYTTSSYEAMEVLNIDFVGPFPDKKYILVLIDAFTRWTELYCCDEATANSAATSLLHHFGRFGCPRTIRSDRGSHFANETIKKFLQMTGVGHNLTLAYSSQENSKVERANKEVNRHLRAFVFDTCSMDNYERGIPFVQRIINATPNQKTGVSPSQLLFGNMLDLDRSIIVPYPERQDYDLSTNLILAQMIATQDRLSAVTREIQLREDQIHMESSSIPVTVFETGSFVLVHRREGLPSRLHTQWLGPMKVLGNTGSEYRLLNLITMKEKLYHAQHMKPFIFNPHQTSPTDVARRDYLEYFVEEILEHTGNPKKLSSLQFLVKWGTYDASHNSWEPYSNLRKTAGLHTYLRQRNLLGLIPAEFR